MTKEYFLNELPEIVQEFLNNLKSGDIALVVGLTGDLGAGKTTFVKEVAKQTGVLSEVTSPTFTVMQNYETNFKNYKKLIHIDLYRFEEGDDIGVLKLNEVFENPENLVLMEWVEKFPEIKTEIKINLKHKEEDKREIEIKYE